MNPNQIHQFLEDVLSDSDISGASDDSRGDEDWVLHRDRDEPDSDPDDPADDDVGPDGDGGGDALDRDLPDLDVSDIPSTPTTSAEPLEKSPRTWQLTRSGQNGSGAGLGTPFFSVRYVTFFSTLKKERSILFRSFLKLLATYETQKNVPFFSVPF